MLSKETPFFTVPQHVLRFGIWARLTPSAQSLYIVLLHEVERRQLRELRVTDARLKELGGVSQRAARDARIKLQEIGLISYRLASGGYVYTILDPKTAAPFPEDPAKRYSTSAPIPKTSKDISVPTERPQATAPSEQGVSLNWDD